MNLLNWSFRNKRIFVKNRTPHDNIPGDNANVDTVQLTFAPSPATWAR